mgnify:CR=1 FL=1
MSRRLVAVLIAAAAVAAVLGAAWWGITALVADPPPKPGPPVTFTVPKGASAAQIAGILEQAGVIGDAGAFVGDMVAQGKGADFKPGTYTLRTNEVESRIVEQLEAGPPDSSQTRVTVPEGFAIWEIEAEVRKVGISRTAYQAALAAHAPPAGFLAPGEHAASLEGFLFPATYDVAVPADADTLVADQLSAFSDTWSDVDLAYARSRGLTAYDVLKVASLIEREARAPGDRAKIAAVIYNRLKLGMTLGIDAAVQYGNGSWRVLKASDLASTSPYNLRVRHGLPPTPICNPGLASMKAAAHPAKVDYLYYYAIKGDPQGRHFFTASYEAFLRYQKEHPYS